MAGDTPVVDPRPYRYGRMTDGTDLGAPGPMSREAAATRHVLDRAAISGLPQDPTPLDTMLHRLKTPEGRTLHARRKHIPEPVFGIIKSVLGFRQFSFRGLVGPRGEWGLVTMAWNVERKFNLAQAAA